MSDNKKEYYTEANNIIYGQLTYAETKNGVLIGFLGAAIIALLTLAFDEMTGKTIDIILYAYSAILGVALFCSLCSFFPNTNTLNNKRNLYFWGDIANFQNADDYEKVFFQEEKDLEKHLANQNIQVSRIIKRKNKLFAIALQIVSVALFPPTLFFFLCRKKK